MRPGQLHSPAALQDRPAGPVGAAADALKVVVVYQDALTRVWALDLWDRVNSALKNETVLLQSWGAADLAQARILPDAIAAAAVADILLVSIRAAAELPPALTTWVEGWVPRRGRLAGTLVALLGTPGEPPVSPLPAERYLQAVAQRARLDFMPRQRALPPAVPALPPGKLQAAPALATSTRGGSQWSGAAPGGLS